MKTSFGKGFINPTLTEFKNYEAQFLNHKTSLKRQNFNLKNTEYGQNSIGRKWTKEIWQKDENWVRLAAKIVGCALLYCFSDYRKSFHEHLQNWNRVWRTGKRQHICQLYAPLLDPETKKLTLWTTAHAKFPKEANLKKQQFDTIYATIDEKCSKKNTLELIEAILKSDSEIQNTLCQLISKCKKKENTGPLNYSEYFDCANFDTNELVKLITKFSDPAFKSSKNLQKAMDVLWKIDPSFRGAAYSYLNYENSLKVVLSTCLETLDLPETMLDKMTDISQKLILPGPLQFTFKGQLSIIKSISILKDEFHDFSIKLTSLGHPSSPNDYRDLYAHIASLSDETIKAAERLFNNQTFLCFFQKPFLNSADSTRTNIYITLTTLETFQKQELLTFLPDEMLINILTQVFTESPLDLHIADFLNKHLILDEFYHKTFDEKISYEYGISLEQAKNVASIIDNNTEIENNQIARLFRIYLSNISNEYQTTRFRGDPFSYKDTWFWPHLLQAMNEVPVEERTNVGEVLEIIGGTLPNDYSEKNRLSIPLLKLLITNHMLRSASAEEAQNHLNHIQLLNEKLEENHLRIAEKFNSHIALARSMLENHSIDQIRRVVDEAQQLLLPSLPVENGIEIVLKLLNEPSSKVRLELITEMVQSQGPNRLKDNYLTAFEDILTARRQLREVS